MPNTLQSRKKLYVTSGARVAAAEGNRKTECATKCKCIRLVSHCEILQWIIRCLSSNLSLKRFQAPIFCLTCTHSHAHTYKCSQYASLEITGIDPAWSIETQSYCCSKVLLIHSMPAMTYTHTHRHSVSTLTRCVYIRGVLVPASLKWIAFNK